MKTGKALWTLDELTAAVATALAKGYEGAASGRVRDVPDRRTIRYYTTLGLIDRPAEMRGRVALYGRRHLLQIVGIKKFQALGRSLAEIQQALTGRTDMELARIAGQDVRELAEQTGKPAAKPDRDFWRQEPAAHEPLSQKIGHDVTSPPADSLAPANGQQPTLLGVPLSNGVTLLLAPSRPLDPHDIEAIRLAAAPLLRTLTLSRLIDPREEGDTP
jgi:DNA-binding transcriptional MerR regulator